DDARKVERTHSGLVAGSGSIDIFQPVVDELRNRSLGLAATTEALKASEAGLFQRAPDYLSRFPNDNTGLCLTSLIEDGPVLNVFFRDTNYEPAPVSGTLQVILPHGVAPGIHVAEQR